MRTTLIIVGAIVLGALGGLVAGGPKFAATDWLCRYNVERGLAAQAAENLRVASWFRRILDGKVARSCEDVTLVYPDGKTELWSQIRLDLERPSGLYR
jgi:hypothetical protein